MDTLLNQVSMVIDNSMLHQRIRDMAHTDGLTGLLNHRTFMEKIEEEFRRLDRENQDFSLLLLDIDYFKKVNDEHGHPVGDIALKSVARTIREMARSIDFVARYGGEEFAVGMVGANSEGARTTAERIRKTVENTDIIAGNVTLRCTLSIGIASHSRSCEKKETLIDQADQALYHAKRSGRNRICLYGDIQSVDDVAEHSRMTK
jgi:diguanylate cyclase (GGDEF)-like protein